MAKKRYFITGTDTDSGKTLVTAAILRAANDAGLSCYGLKPVAAGCEVSAEGLRNSDALILQAHSSVQLSYEQINPVAFEAPIAPHIAAAKQGAQLTVGRLAAYCRGSMMRSAELVLVEGAGGWRVPLNNREMLSGLAKELNLPVILVVGMKLGCINHALLTAEAIARDGATLAGWVANGVDPNMSEYQANLETLKGMIRAPLLAEIPWLSESSIESASSYIDLKAIISD